MQAGCDSDTGTCSDTDAIFCISTNGSIGIFLKEDMLLVNPSKLPDLYQPTGNTFSGFTLAVFDIPDEVVSYYDPNNLISHARAYTSDSASYTNSLYSVDI